MTREERIAAAKARLAEAERAYGAAAFDNLNVNPLAGGRGRYDAVVSARAALAEAEKPERPRLMTPTDAVLAQLSRDGGIWTHVPSGLSGGIAISAVARRDDEIGEAVRKLPRYRSRHPLDARGLITEPTDTAVECVALADVIALLEGR